MGIRNWIAEQKEAHQRGRLLAMKAEGSKLQMENYELEKKRQAQEALYKEKLANENLKQKIEANAQSLKNVGGPSKVQKFGQGLAKTINSARKGIKEHKSKVGGRIGAPMSSGSSGLQVNQRDVFGGRNLDFGGSSKSNFSFGPTQKEQPIKEKPKRIVINL